MKYLRLAALLSFLPLFCLAAFAGAPQAGTGAGKGQSTNAPRMSKQTRMELIRLLNAELVYVRSPFPMGKDGLKLHNGAVTPTGPELAQLMAMWGPAAKNGDAVRITGIVFKDNYVHVEINGGPVKKQKWYEHISVGGAGGESPVAPSDSNANARGSFVNVYFDHYIPEMTGQDFKQMLRPVLDFDAKSVEEAYLETVPPKAKAAIENHQVLVGMNREMVTYAKGRPPKKIREKQDETEYEEWIYGEPPKDVEFVRFIGDEVVRLETMKVDGTKIVKTDKELSLDPVTKVAQQQDEAKPAGTPTLRRAGEESDSPVPRTQTSPRTTPRPAGVPDPGPTSTPNILP